MAFTARCGKNLHQIKNGRALEMPSLYISTNVNGHNIFSNFLESQNICLK